MRLSTEEMVLFNSACSNPNNLHAQDLLNVFGAERAIDILDKMTTIPLGIVVDVVSHMWNALAFEAAHLGVPDFQLFEPPQE